MARAPSSRSSKASKPTASAIDRPTDDHSEKRPPIQSQNSNMLAGSMPNSVTASRLVDTATKCRASWFSATPLRRNQSRMLRALAMVSSVVNVLEQMITSVRAGLRRTSVSASSVPSTLETKWMRGPVWSPRCASARQTMRGPRSEPPMPMLTTSVMVWPVEPVQAPPRTRSEKSCMRQRTSWMAGITETPSTLNGASGSARSATCRAARSSVVLMCSPANMASRRCVTPASSASFISSAKVSNVMRFLE
ncbi:hypothetical protein D3C81_1461230 [compost metagenome]